MSRNFWPSLGAPIHVGDTVGQARHRWCGDEVRAGGDLGGVQIHRTGTLIGKALEPLAKGSGEILVLLSLQWVPHLRYRR